MKTIKVNASTSYDVIVGNNLLSSLPDLLKNAGIDGKVAIVTDKTVNSLYADKVINILSSYYSCFKFVVEDGEKSKSGQVFLSILDFLAENEFTRSDTVIALGGGVVGDLTGFVASSYLRGIKFVQIPTSLLAMVDASVGGKTAINLTAGKNLAGAFYQPSLVVVDTDCLSTLTESEYKSGMGEVIKYAMIFDKDLLALLQSGWEDNKEEIIARCIDLKRKVVETDEKDNGERQLLNFGHTLGHAIEKQTNFKISHGQAVAIGMSIITDIAIKKGLCDKEVKDILDKLLAKYNLPSSIDISLDELYTITTIDKKRKGNDITIVLPKQKGKCVLTKMEINEWRSFLTD